MVLITYDVSTTARGGKRRLRKIAKKCLDYGLRVQNSVFQCEVDPVQWEVLKSDLLKLYNSEADSLRFYFLGSNWSRRVEHHGTKEIPDLEGPMIF